MHFLYWISIYWTNKIQSFIWGAFLKTKNVIAYKKHCVFTRYLRPTKYLSGNHHVYKRILAILQVFIETRNNGKRRTKWKSDKLLNKKIYIYTRKHFKIILSYSLWGGNSRERSEGPQTFSSNKSSSSAVSPSLVKVGKWGVSAYGLKRQSCILKKPPTSPGTWPFTYKMLYLVFIRKI